MNSEIIALRVRIEGHVQGVGYRAWMIGQARDLKIEGFVRNRKDGCVEALLKGPSDAVAALTRKLWQGPAFCHVTAVQTEAAQGVVGAGFRQLPTV